jgi:SAM-dependent methyltransferase
VNVHYRQDFYATRRRSTFRAAQTVLGILRERTSPETVVDVGCGTGTWLSVALQAGSRRAVGFEGEWVRPEMMDDPRIELHRQDLENRVRFGERFDLAISLEVAEHLSEARAQSFVEDLCDLSDVVLFSAAIPGQQGVNHINLQWQSWWARHFGERGYVALDLVRPVIWQTGDIPYWYRQNILLFVREPMLTTFGPDARPATMLDVVHPALAARVPTIRDRIALLAEVPRMLARRLPGRPAG